MPIPTLPLPSRVSPISESTASEALPLILKRLVVSNVKSVLVEPATFLDISPSPFSKAILPVTSIPVDVVASFSALS